jgi:membrane protein YdbS with pleckstrin-like domain
MEKFNRVLYVISVVCVLFTTILSLIAIWGDVEEGVWKAVGSGVVILLACVIMLGVNFRILKMRAEIEGKRENKTEPNIGQVSSEGAPSDEPSM